MNAFDHMMNTLTADSFKDLGAKQISRTEYEIFLKEVIFEKLKGKRFGEAFTERFGIKDRVLSMYQIDKNALDHIKHCKYVE